MIAYLFWHWPREPTRYEGDLIDFHRRLAAAGVAGLVANTTYRIEGAGWPGGSPAYEDWYLLGGFGDLEALNEQAVSPPMKEAHDRPAHATAGAAGGLYRVLSGQVDLSAESVTWLTKPAGMGYEQFYAELPVTDCLMRRQLTLGPAPEFCAFGSLPGGTQVRRRRLFSA